jgi:uncharacterized Zn-binding protein involved in type VI secretion
MKIANYSYVLECQHTAVANVAENDTMGVYHQGDKIVCPKCKYQKKVIISEDKSISEVH